MELTVVELSDVGLLALQPCRAKTAPDSLSDLLQAIESIVRGCNAQEKTRTGFSFVERKLLILKDENTTKRKRVFVSLRSAALRGHQRRKPLTVEPPRISRAYSQRRASIGSTRVARQGPAAAPPANKSSPSLRSWRSNLPR
jgi:hypothetical protein